MTKSELVLAVDRSWNRLCKLHMQIASFEDTLRRETQLNPRVRKQLEEQRNIECDERERDRDKFFTCLRGLMEELDPESKNLLRDFLFSVCPPPGLVTNYDKICSEFHPLAARFWRIETNVNFNSEAALTKDLCLTERQIEILFALARQKANLAEGILKVDLAKAVECSARTIGDDLKTLIEAGLVIKPSKRKGFKITKAGRQHLVFAR